MDSFSPTDKFTLLEQNFSFVEGYFVVCVPLGAENVQIRDRLTG
jgi:hypothetical protein